MARNFQTNLILAGNSQGGIRAMRQVQGELDKTARESRGLSRQFQRQNQISRQLAGTFKTLGVTLAASFSVGATVRTFSRLADEGDRIAKTARNIAISAEFLQEFRGAGELAGNTVQDIDDALRRFNRRLGLFISDGSGPAAKSVEQLGLNLRNAQGQFIGTEAALDQTIDAIAGLPSVAEQAAAASQLFGDDAGPKLVNLLSQGTEGVDELREKIRETGGVMSDEAVSASERYADATLILSQQFRGLTVQIFEGLLPGLTSTLEAMGQTSEEASELAGFGEGLATSLNVVIRALIIVRESALAVAEVVLGLGVTVVGAFRQIIAPIEGTIRGLAEASQQLVEGEFKAAADAVRGIGGEISAAFNDAQKQTDRGLGFIGDSIEKRVSNAIEGVNRIAAALDQVPESAERAGESVEDGVTPAVETLGESAAAAAADGFGELIRSVNEFAAEAADDAIEQATKVRESFEDVRGELIQQIVQARGAGDALIEYNRELAQADAVARAGVDPTSAMAEEIRKLAGAAFDASEGLDQASASGSGFFGQIGSNFAQSVIQGNGLQDSLSNALTGFGGQGIGEALDATDLSGFVKTAFQDGIAAAFEDSEFQRNSAAGFALAIGQAVDGNLGQAAFTALGNAIGGEIGAVIGSIIGDALFGESRPKFQVRGRDATRATDAGTDRVINTAFGAELEIAFRGIEDQAKRQIVRGYTDFLDTLSGVIRDPEQQSEIAQAIERFGISSRSGPDDIEGQLELLFDDILGTFDSFTRGFVEQAETLDGQVQRLNDVLRLENISARGQDFGLDFGPLVQTLDSLAIGSESLLDTFTRLQPAVTALDRAAALTGNQFAETREGLLAFGSELVSIFGDDAGQFSGILNRVLEAAFSDEQLAQQTIEAARQRATDLLTQLGITVTEQTFTQQGLQDLLTDFLGNLGPDQTAQLLEAGDAIASLIEAQGQLADSTDQLAESTRDAATVGRILEGLELDATRAGLDGLQLALFDFQQRQEAVTDRLREAGATAAEIAIAERLLADERSRIVEEFRAQSQGLSDAATGILESLAPARLEFATLQQRIETLTQSERDLGIARLTAELQIQGFISSLRDSLPTLIDEFNGAGDAAESAGNQIAQGVANTRDAWLSAIDSIQSALDSQLVGPNSSLTNRERLGEIESQLQQAVQAALSGDLGAAQDIPGLFNQAISQGANFFGTSTDQFANFEQRLRELVGSVPENATIPPEVTTAQNTARIADNTESLERSAFEQFQLATQIVDQIGLLASLTPETAAQIAEANNADITELIRTLTGEAPEATGDALAGFFNDLVDETNAQLNEFAQLEQIGNDQLSAIAQGNRLLAGILGTLGGQGIPVEDGSGRRDDLSDPGGGSRGDLLGGFANGGPVDFTGPALVHSGEFVVPQRGALVSSDPAQRRLLERAVAALEQANADRRTGTEVMTENISELVAIEIGKQRTDRSDSLRRNIPRRELGASR